MRQHYLDNGKALASLLGIVYHTALIFIGSGWIISVSQTYSLPALRIYTEYINLFRMPLFLFVSGYFAAYAVQKYNLKDFTARRLIRLGVPFVSTLLTFGVIEKIYACRFRGAPLSALTDTITPWSPDFQLSHLWFLYYVILFSFMLYAGLAVKRRYFPHAFHRFRLRRISADVLFLAGISGFLGGCGLLFLMTEVHHELLSLLNIGAYFPYFLLGAVAFLRRDELDSHFFELSGSRFAALFILLIASYILSGQLSDIVPNTDTLLDTFPRYFSLVLVLGLLYRFLNKSNRVLRYMSESSYSVYLLHHPVIVVIGYYYAKYFELPSPVWGYVLVLAASIIVTYGLDYLIIRKTKLGKFLFTGAIRSRSNVKPEIQGSVTHG